MQKYSEKCNENSCFASLITRKIVTEAQCVMGLDTNTWDVRLACEKGEKKGEGRGKEKGRNKGIPLLFPFLPSLFDGWRNPAPCWILNKSRFVLTPSPKLLFLVSPIFQAAFFTTVPNLPWQPRHYEHEQATLARSKNTPALHSKTRRALSRRKEGGLVTMKRPNLPFQKCLHCWQKLPWFESAHSWLA